MSERERLSPRGCCSAVAFRALNLGGAFRARSGGRMGPASRDTAVEAVQRPVQCARALQPGAPAGFLQQHECCDRQQAIAGWGSANSRYWKGKRRNARATAAVFFAAFVSLDTAQIRCLCVAGGARALYGASPFN